MGVFERIWKVAEGSKFLILVLDEINAIFEDKRYKPSDFLYRLLRHRETGRPPLVYVLTITNLLMGIDSLLDSRVRSRIGTESVYFPPYREDEIFAIIKARRDAFKPEALTPIISRRCARLVAEEHGDARRALDLLRTAGETADARGSSVLGLADVERAEKVLEIERTSRAIKDLPLQEVLLIDALTGMEHEIWWKLVDEGKGPSQNPPVPADALFDRYLKRASFWKVSAKGRRRFLDFLQDLEMQRLVGSVNESSGRLGRRKLVWIEGYSTELGTQAFRYLAQNCPVDLGQFGIWDVPPPGADK